MLTVQVKLSVDDIIDSLEKLSADEREKLKNALADLKEGAALQASVNRGLDDVKNGRIIPHAEVMEELKARYKF
jgi:predicted transcriptional regulator